MRRLLSLLAPMGRIGEHVKLQEYLENEEIVGEVGNQQASD